MHRFFLDPASINGSHVTFSPEISRQMNLVLRLRPGMDVVVLDGSGAEYRVCLTDVASDVSIGEVTAAGVSAAEPKTRLTLILGLTQREKFEWMLQKCTEVGVSTFLPVISSRSLVQSGKEVESKYERWQRILREAAEQSHRGRIPELRPVLRLEEAFRLDEIKGDCRLIPWEEESSVGLRAAMACHPSCGVTLAIGPEGGFSGAEIDAARSAGFSPVTLGPRILRMETAAVTAAALVLFERGDMGSASDQTPG
jgi:16S rRNA (uracil1498-N3)-methyltransferase